MKNAKYIFIGMLFSLVLITTGIIINIFFNYYDILFNQNDLNETEQIEIQSTEKIEQADVVLTVLEYLSSEEYIGSLSEKAVETISDFKTVLEVFVITLRNGDYKTLNLLLDEDKYTELQSDPLMAIEIFQPIFMSRNIGIGENGYIYTRLVSGSRIYSLPHVSGGLICYIEKENNRFYLRSFGEFNQEFAELDIENYIKTPYFEDFPCRIHQDSLDSCRDKQTLVSLLESALLKNDWIMISKMKRESPYVVNEPTEKDEPQVVQWNKMFESNIVSLTYSDLSADDNIYRFQFKVTLEDGTWEAFIAWFSEKDGIYVLDIVS